MSRQTSFEAGLRKIRYYCQGLGPCVIETTTIRSFIQRVAQLMTARGRPVFLNPLAIQLPVGALTSIGHRVSGVVLSVSVPAWVYLWGLSMRDEQGFARASALMGYAVVKVGLVLFMWALAHHVLAGIRHLLSDMNIGSTLRSARRTAYAANLGGVGIAFVAAWLLW